MEFQEQSKTGTAETTSGGAQVSIDNGHKPPFRRKIRGEEPADEMRRKGLGEEPRLAFSSSQKHSGQKFSDIYVLELLLVRPGLQSA